MRFWDNEEIVRTKAPIMTLSCLGICGAGHIASALARQIAVSGTRIIIHGFAPPVTPRKARIDIAANLFDLASECDVVIAVYDTHAALRAALSGTVDRPGLLGAMVPGSLLVDLSGGLPDETRKLAAQLAGGAIGLVEGAFVGGSNSITDGTARVFLGGFGDHIDQLMPTLSTLGTIKRTGPQGSARMYVALSESVRAAYHVAMAEAVAIAEVSGFVPADLASPPLSEEEVAQFGGYVHLALAQAAATPTPFLTSLALRLSTLKPT